MCLDILVYNLTTTGLTITKLLEILADSRFVFFSLSPPPTPSQTQTLNVFPKHIIMIITNAEFELHP